MVCMQLNFVAPYGFTGPVVLWFFTQSFIVGFVMRFIYILVFCSHFYQTIEVFHQIVRSVKDTWWISALVASLVISAGGRISTPSNMCPGFLLTLIELSSLGQSLKASACFPLAYSLPLQWWLSCQIETKGGYLSWPDCSPNPQCPDYCSLPSLQDDRLADWQYCEAELRWDKDREREGDEGSLVSSSIIYVCLTLRCWFVSLPFL